MLPEAKLDILLAHHASLEAELLGQLNSEKYVQITRELAELNPLIDAVKTGDIIASAGNSGGNEQSGLYFEMRHQGRAFDPLGWVTSR